MADKKRIGIRAFFGEVRKELFEKTVWPTRAEVLSQTVIVIFVLIISSIGLGAIDYISTFVTRALLQDNIVAVLLSSRLALFIVLAFVLLVIVYFAVKYIRKNRYNG